MVLDTSKPLSRTPEHTSLYCMMAHVPFKTAQALDLLVQRDRGDHGQKAVGLVPDGPFNLVPEVVAALEAVEVTPDGESRKLQAN